MALDLNPPTLGAWSPEGPADEEFVCLRKSRFRNIERIEASAGLFATIVLGFTPVILAAVGTLALLNSGRPVLAMLCGCLTLVSAGLAVFVGAIVSQAVRCCFPEWADDPTAQLQLKPDHLNRFHPARSFAVETGLSIPRVPELVQPLLSLWWLLHFAGGAVVVLTIHRVIGVSFPESVPGLVLAILGQFSFLMGSNLYLVLAVSAWSAEERLLEQVWNARFAIDISLTLLVTLYCL